MKPLKCKPEASWTSADWQHACELAEVWLMVDAARKYGLIAGGPTICVDRCDELIGRAAAKGIRPRPDAVSALVAAVAAENAELPARVAEGRRRQQRRRPRRPGAPHLPE